MKRLFMLMLVVVLMFAISAIAFAAPAANEFLTMQEIARLALPILMDNIVFPNLIFRQYSKDFANKGDTIQVKRPPIFSAKEFDPNTGIEIQDVKTGKVPVKIDKWKDVSNEVSHKDRALNVEDFVREVIEPMATALAEQINADGLDLYKDIPYFTGVAGTTPDALSDIAAVRRSLNVNKAPSSMRKVVWDSYADEKLATLDALVSINKSGSAAALRDGEIGRVHGLDNYHSQAVKTHTAGAYTALNDVTAAHTVPGTILNDAATGFDYSSVVLTSAAGASTAALVKGDLLTFSDDNGKAYQCAVLEDTAAAVAGVVTVKLIPALTGDVTDLDVTFVDETSGAHVANIGFHERAFSFVTVPLPLPSDKEAYVMTMEGLTFRVVYGYDQTFKKDIMSMDILYGYKTMYPELATIALG